MEDGKEFWDQIEDFCYGMEENVRMEDGKSVFHSIPLCALVRKIKILSPALKLVFTRVK